MPARPAWTIARSPYRIAAFLAVCTILIRLPNFGDPTYHIDEAFYLFVGQQMHDGLLPYADVWDRKPAGLFVLFAIIAQFFMRKLQTPEIETYLAEGGQKHSRWAVARVSGLVLIGELLAVAALVLGYFLFFE